MILLPYLLAYLKVGNSNICVSRLDAKFMQKWLMSVSGWVLLGVSVYCVEFKVPPASI